MPVRPAVAAPEHQSCDLPVYVWSIAWLFCVFWCVEAEGDFETTEEEWKTEKKHRMSTKRTEDSAEGFSGQTVYFSFPIGVADTWTKCQ